MKAFYEIISMLPNGLHDAELQGIMVSFENSTIELRVRVWVGNLGQDNWEIYKDGILKFSGLYFIEIERPDPEYLKTFEGLPTLECGIGFRNKAKVVLPDDVEPIWFFASDWNSFIYLASKEAEFNWVADASSDAK